LGYRPWTVPLDPPLGSVPRQARGIAARARIYEAARAQFAAKGVEGARVEEIVGAAGVAWGTFFRYFPRKEDVLLEAAVRHFRERVVPVVEGALDEHEQPAREVARLLFHALLSPAEHPAPLHGAIVREVVDRRERFAALLGDDQAPLVVFVARVVAQGQERGEVRDDIDALTLAGVLTAGTLFTTLQGYYRPLRGLRGLDTIAGPEALVERSFGVVWRGLEPR
jgi:AcrR family transcriptional regulator